jgi:hypothetical protein
LIDDLPQLANFRQPRVIAGHLDEANNSRAKPFAFVWPKQSLGIILYDSKLVCLTHGQQVLRARRQRIGLINVIHDLL